MQIRSGGARTASSIEKSPETINTGSPVDTGSGSDLVSDSVGPIIMRWREETSREEPWNVYHAGWSNEVIGQLNQRTKEAETDDHVEQ